MQTQNTKKAEQYYDENIDATNIPREHYEYEIIQLMKDFGYDYATHQTENILTAIEGVRNKITNIPYLAPENKSGYEEAVNDFSVILDELITKLKTK